MRPDGFDTLSVSLPNAIHVGKAEGCLTQRRVTEDVEVRNCNAERVEGVEANGWSNAVGEEALSQIDSPLTGNVVGDNDVGYASRNSIRDGRHKGVVSVHMSE